MLDALASSLMLLSLNGPQTNKLMQRLALCPPLCFFAAFAQPWYSIQGATSAVYWLTQPHHEGGAGADIACSKMQGGMRRIDHIALPRVTDSVF